MTAAEERQRAERLAHAAFEQHRRTRTLVGLPTPQWCELDEGDKRYWLGIASAVVVAFTAECVATCSVMTGKNMS